MFWTIVAIAVASLAGWAIGSGRARSLLEWGRKRLGVGVALLFCTAALQAQAPDSVTVDTAWVADSTPIITRTEFRSTGEAPPPSRDTLPDGVSPAPAYTIDSTSGVKVAADSTVLVYWITPPNQKLTRITADPNVPGGIGSGGSVWQADSTGYIGPVVYRLAIACSDPKSIGVDSISASGRTWTDVRGGRAVDKSAPVVCGGVQPPPIILPPPTPTPGTVIQRWDMDDWTITGANGGTTEWTNGSNQTPTGPHRLVTITGANGATNSIYRLVVPTIQYSSWLGWNFVGGQTFGSVTVDFDFRLTQPVTKQIKGIRFGSGTTQWPGGKGWGGLFVQRIGDGSGFSFQFDGISPYQHVTGAYFDNGQTQVVINGLADGQWHHLTLTYDVSQPRKRMRLVIDGTPIAQPDGPSLQGSGFDGGCTSTVAGPGAFWQNGWLVSCGTDPANVIGRGQIFDINKRNEAAGVVIELDNWVWSH